jgi:signal transduction histidine kinase
MSEHAPVHATPTPGSPGSATAVEYGAGGFWRQVGYLIGGLPLAIAAFVIAVAGFAAGVGTFVVWLGLPILVGTLAASRGLAGVERRSTEWATGRPLPPHHYRQARGRGVGIGRMFRMLAEPQSWRDLLHGVVAFPIRLFTFVVAVSWTVGGLGSLLYVTWQWALPENDADGGGGLYWLLTGNPSRLGEIVVNTVLGVIMVATSPLVVRGLVAIRAGLARGLLTNQTAALRARAVQLESSRRAAVHAEAQTLRRLERDIHDGPQQRLVRLNMDLETVVRRLDDDPDRARPLVTEALTQSREALDELRALSRGIAPPILADRGLGPALAAAAARCPVEVSLDVALPQGSRLAAAVENTAYFVVTEALTNVAKHAHATLCTVVVSADADRVLVQVRDDGRGGAHLGKGHGLAGLADRLATVEGVLDVVSPVGGPTVLTAEIPLAGLGEDH